MDKYNLIALDGPDGTGKTTLSKLLAEKTNCIYIKTPPNNLNKIRFNFDWNPSARFSFYLLSVLDLPEECFLDRYILSTIAYHSVLNPKEKTNYKETTKELIKKGFIKKPDLQIILTVDEHERKKRIKNRENSYNFYDDDDNFQKKIANEFQELIKTNFLELTDSQYLIMNNTNTDINTTKNNILKRCYYD